MNFLHPAAVQLLPKRARCSIAVVYSMHLADARRSASGESDRGQEHLAAWLGCDVRTVRRHELELVRRKLIEIVHHGRGNRRRIRPVELRKGPRASRESGQFCPDGADRIVRTVRSEATSSIPRRILSEEASAPRAERRAVAGKETSSPGGTKTAADAALDKALQPAVVALIERCGIHRHGWDGIRDLARDMARLTSTADAVQMLGWAAEQTAGASRKTRGGRTIGLLRTMVLNLDEKGAPRTGKAVRARG